MKPNEPQHEATKPRFRRGDWVAYTTGLSRHVAEVLEDCGLVGVRAHRFYRLREPIWYGEPVEYELPEETLEPATRQEVKGVNPPDVPPKSDQYDTWDDPVVG